MTLIVKPFTFTAGTKAKASEVNSDLDTIYTAFNGLIGEANLTWVTASDGIRGWRSGPNAGGTNGSRIALLSRTFALGGAVSGTQTYTFSSADSILGNPSFSATPTASGICILVSVAAPSPSVPIAWLSAITSTTATLQWDRTTFGGVVNLSVTMSFWVAGNV